MLWRRSYDVPPPHDRATDPEFSQDGDPRYADLGDDVPKTECLADVVARMLPYWERPIVRDLRAGKVVLLAAHGNSLRALVKHLDGITDEGIAELNIPTGIPLRYELDDDLRPIERRRQLPRSRRRRPRPSPRWPTRAAEPAPTPTPRCAGLAVNLPVNGAGNVASGGRRAASRRAVARWPEAAPAAYHARRDRPGVRADRGCWRSGSASLVGLRWAPALGRAAPPPAAGAARRGRRSLDLLQRVFRSADAGLAVLDRDGDVVLHNARAAELGVVRRRPRPTPAPRPPASRCSTDRRRRRPSTSSPLDRRGRPPAAVLAECAPLGGRVRAGRGRRRLRGGAAGGHPARLRGQRQPRAEDAGRRDGRARRGGARRGRRPGRGAPVRHARSSTSPPGWATWSPS